MHAQTTSDPIDELIPPPRPWWVRLVVGLVIVSVVGVGAALWGYGFVFPQPGCCGSGGGSAQMSTTADRTAVTVTVVFFNSSGRELRISDASADLPGATVLGIAMLDEDNDTFPISRTTPLPATIDGTTTRRLVVTFVPTSCRDDRDPWGKLTVELDVVNGWLPSIGRTYTVPGAIFDGDPSSLSLFPPEGVDSSTLITPLAAACALLGR
ncbi:MAG TPA: hypothetical protein VNO51_11605 [Ilumatobacteraceae bacterium]|nr:hypothetical protein [Ilumatobacteraceae bacterium]